jgi:glycosyltransferase involved in cell wall biosynthesis
MPEPSVSVVIPAYNPDMALLRRAVQSALAQQGLREILIVADHACVPDDWGALTAMSTRVRLLHTGHEGAGSSSARNLGIRAAKGIFVVFLDADDELMDGRLDRALKILETDRIDVVCCSTRIEFEDGSEPMLIGETLPERVHLVDFAKIHHPITVVMRWDWALMFPFDPSVRFSEDALFLYTLAEAGARMAWDPQPGYRYRILRKSMSHDIDALRLGDRFDAAYAAIMARTRGDVRNLFGFKRSLNARHVQALASGMTKADFHHWVESLPQSERHGMDTLSPRSNSAPLLRDRQPA